MTRLERWDLFSEQVRRHIVQYANPQYANGGEEQIDSFSPEDCWKHIDRYSNRSNSAVRGPMEQLRDTCKVAHYAAEIYLKRRDQSELPDVYPEGGENECS